MLWPQLIADLFNAMVLWLMRHSFILIAQYRALKQGDAVCVSHQLYHGSIDWVCCLLLKRHMGPSGRHPLGAQHPGIRALGQLDAGLEERFLYTWLDEHGSITAGLVGLDNSS